MGKSYQFVYNFGVKNSSSPYAIVAENADYKKSNWAGLMTFCSSTHENFTQEGRSTK